MSETKQAGVHWRRFGVRHRRISLAFGCDEIRSNNGDLICTMRDKNPQHADLIAAAPDMAEALHMVTTLECILGVESPPLENLKAHVRAVLAKAGVV